MQITDIDEWVAHFGDPTIENNIDHFYLDTTNNLTIGIGCRVFNLIELPMLRRVDDEPATLNEISIEAGAIRMLPAGQPMPFYAKVAKLYLAPADVVTLFQGRLEQTAKELESHIGPLDGDPPIAQMAILDMAFNLGVTELMRDFPHFINGFVIKDWHVCALECRRLKIPPERNEWTRQAFQSLIAA